MSVSRRYSPSHPQGSRSIYGVDLSPMLPPGLGIQTADAQILTNTVPPQSDPTINLSDPNFKGRIAWATIQGGTQGQDYLIAWTITDNVNNIWLITLALLCAATS